MIIFVKYLVMGSVICLMLGVGLQTLDSQIKCNT